MPKIERILCPVDFSEFSEWAYRHALSLARHFRAKLLVQHVVESWRHTSAWYAPPDGYEHLHQRLFDDSQRQLWKFVNNFATRAIQPHCMVREGIAPDSILELAEAEHVDLIIMGTHGRRGFDRLMVGSVTERVMRQAPCPVLAVHRHRPLPNLVVPAEGQDSVCLGRILFCTDFSEHSRQALDYASMLASEYGSEILLVHVLESIPDPAAIEQALFAATDRLAKLIPLENCDAGKHRTAVRIGKPYEQIIALAVETQSDLALMGVHGSSAMDLSVFGSTTHRVIQLGPCPVLLVHS